MDSLDGLFFLSIISIILLLFWLIITIFGGIFLYILYKKRNEDWKITLLEFSLLSFSIGISLYLFISYILDIFQIFNFFFGYLPIVIADVIFLVYLYKKNEIEKIQKVIERKIRNNPKSIYYFLIILGVSVGVLFFKFWSKIGHNSALLSKDPYAWTASVMYLLDYEHMNYEWFGNEYPPGFTFINSGALLIMPIKTVQYYYMKFAFIPYLVLYIIILYAISMRVFNGKYHLVFFTVILLFSFNFFLQRSIMFLPSLVANLIILGSAIIIYAKVPNWLLGFNVLSLYLIHNITALFFIVFLSILYGWIFISALNNRNKLKNLMYEIGQIITTIFILLIPYLIHMNIYWNQTVVGLVSYYLEKFDPSFSVLIKNSNTLSLNPIVIFNFSVGLSLPSLLGRLDQLIFKRTISVFFFFILIGMFIRSNKFDNESLNKIYFFMKTSVLVIVAIYLIPDFLGLEALTTQGLFSTYRIRMLDNFAGFFIILAGIGWQWIIDKIILSWQWIANKSSKLKAIFEKNQKLVNIKNIFILLTIISPITIAGLRQDFYYRYVSHDKFAENILYIIENVPKGNTLLIPDFNNDNDGITQNSYHRLLYDYQEEYYNLTKNYSIEEFNNLCVSLDVNYFLFRRSDWNGTFLESFDSNASYKLVYQLEKDDWIFGVYKFE